MKSSAAISDAGPTVDDPSMMIVPDSPSACSPGAQPARTSADAENKAATEISFLFNLFLLIGLDEGRLPASLEIIH
jgi:hypothetical protein